MDDYKTILKLNLFMKKNPRGDLILLLFELPDTQP
jgi:hypothetical protein